MSRYFVGQIVVETEKRDYLVQATTDGMLLVTPGRFDDVSCYFGWQPGESVTQRIELHPVDLLRVYSYRDKAFNVPALKQVLRESGVFNG